MLMRPVTCPRCATVSHIPDDAVPPLPGGRQATCVECLSELILWRQGDTINAARMTPTVGPKAGNPCA